MPPRLCIAITILCAAAAGLQADPAEEFARANPDYRTRAGTFYEKKYLPGATKGLMAVLAPQEVSEEQVEKVLLALIYEFLDQYAQDASMITRRGQARVLARMDARVAELAGDSGEILHNYKVWKTGSSKAFPNPLSFMTVIARQSPPLKLKLSPELVDEGWRLVSLESLRATGEYADVLGIEPYQVFLLRRQGDDAESRGLLTLLVYRRRDAAKLLSAADLLRAKDRGGPTTRAVPQLFWRTDKLLIFLAQETQLEGDEAVREWVRRQWIRIY